MDSNAHKTLVLLDSISDFVLLRLIGRPGKFCEKCPRYTAREIIHREADSAAGAVSPLVIAHGRME